MEKAEKDAGTNGIEIIADVIAGCWVKETDRPISYGVVYDILENLKERGFKNTNHDISTLSLQVLKRIYEQAECKDSEITESSALRFSHSARETMRTSLAYVMSRGHRQLVSATRDAMRDIPP